MAQQIFATSTADDVKALLESYIYTDTDGSKRVNEEQLRPWLNEQFSYFTANNPGSAAVSAEVDRIVSRLKASINREAWTSNVDWPQGATAAARTTDVRNRLVTVQQEMVGHIKAIEAEYGEAADALPGVIEYQFRAVAADVFPKGITRNVVSVAYISTYVTDWGEESAPSPVSTIVDVDDNDVKTVSFGDTPPAGRNIAKRRLWRSATGTEASAFQLQGEYDIAQASVTDDVKQERLGASCATFGWSEPPADLANLTAMPNGIMIGSVGRTLYACEPYKPYAWPDKYRKPLAHQINGIVAVGQSAFIGTARRPYFLSGADSASLTEELISSKVPCLSAPSMVAIENSVLYASPNGLALFEGGRVSIVTQGIIDRKTWRSYRPSTMRAGEFNGMYLAFYTKADGTKGCLIFDLASKTISELDQAADAVFTDESGLYILDGTVVRDCAPSDGANRVAKWHSKTFRLNRPQAFKWVHVDSSFMNGSTPTSATVRIYADGALLHTAVVTSRNPVRCKPGRFSDWRVEIESDAVIDGFTMASTTEELKEVL